MVLVRLVVGLGGCAFVCAVYPWLPETIWCAAALALAVHVLNTNACIVHRARGRPQDGLEQHS